MKAHTTTPSPLTITGLLGDFRLLVILFVAFRLLLLMTHQPLLTPAGERGITVGGDYQTYYHIAALSDSLGQPFVNWWSEFPPVWAFLTVGLYQVQGDYAGFALVLGLLLLAFDTGNLILIDKIGARLHGANTGLALAWVYALLVAPLVFTFWTFEGMVAFWLLLGVWWLLDGRDTRSALAGAVGALTKFTPALILGAVWRFRGRKQAGQYTAVLVGLFALAYVPLFAGNASMTLPSLTAQFNKASYQTVWALLDGNYRTGNFGPLEYRGDPARASMTEGWPAVIPSWLRLAAAAGVGVFVFVRSRRLDDKGLVAFVAITLLIFYIQAQGWSPQWLAQIIPLLLLCFPTRDGVLVAVMLSLVTFAEYPFLFIRTGDTGGRITESLVAPFALLVIARTALLVGVCVALYKRLRQKPVR